MEKSNDNWKKKVMQKRNKLLLESMPVSSRAKVMKILGINEDYTSRSYTYRDYGIIRSK